MDGVVADFDRYAHQKLGVGPSEGKYPQNVWEILIENPRLYRELETTPYATELYDLCVKTAKKLDYRVAFLTAIPRKNDVQHAMYDKVNWARKHFPKHTGIPCDASIDISSCLFTIFPRDRMCEIFGNRLFVPLISRRLLTL